MTTELKPIAGMGATICYATDRRGATVVRVSASGKTCWVQADIRTMESGHNIHGIQKWNHTPNENAELVRYALNGDGRWVEYGGSTRLLLGERDSYFDPHF